MSMTAAAMLAEHPRFVLAAALKCVPTQRVGLTCTQLEKVTSRLTCMGLIDFDTFQPCAWDERQMQSNTRAERVQAYRERVKQTRSVSVRAEKTDTEKEREQTRTAAALDPPEGAKQAPVRVSMPMVICMAMKATGIGTVNALHPAFQALIDKAAGVGLFPRWLANAFDKRRFFT